MDQASSLRKMVSEKHSTSGGIKPGGSTSSPLVLAVTSGKGGVGKTNLVGNLAECFRAMGQRVLIIDADLGLANVDILFGMHPKYHIGHVINGEKKVQEVMITTDSGISVIPAGSGVSELTHLTEGQKLNLLGEFESLDRAFHVVLVDTGAGISSNVLYFNQAADECLVVATMEPTSVTDAYALMKVMANDYGARRFKLLVNMVGNVKDAKNVYLNLSQAAEKFLNNVVIEYTGFIPMDNAVRNAVLKRTRVVVSQPDAAASQSIKKLARTLLSSPRSSDSAGNIKFFFNRLFAGTS